MLHLLPQFVRMRDRIEGFERASGASNHHSTGAGHSTKGKPIDADALFRRQQNFDASKGSQAGSKVHVCYQNRDRRSRVASEEP